MALLEANNLAKSYKKRPVVMDVSIAVEKAQIVGFWAPMVQVKQPVFI